MTRRLRSLAVLCSSLACAHAGPTSSPPPPLSLDTSTFPTKDALHSLAGRAHLDEVFDETTVAVQAWDLVGPFPTTPVSARVTDGSPFGRVLADAVAAHPQWLATESLACVARELGRFFLQKRGHAPQPLQRFVRGRCLDVQPDLHLNVLTLTRATAGDDVLAAQFHDQLVDAIAHGAGGASEVGLWFGRSGDDAIVYLASATRAVNVAASTLAPTVAPGRAVLDVDLLSPAARIDALFNRGPFGVGTCEVAAQPPRVHLVCPFAAADPSTWLDVLSYAPGHILGFPVLELLAWPHGSPSNHWQAAGGAAPKPMSASNARATFIEALNAARAQVGLRRVILAAPESDELDAVAPVYFASVAGKVEPAYADLIALGTMAGWDVAGGVKAGAFASGVVFGTNDAAVLVAELASFPASRQTLFDPDASSVAVAPLMPAKQAGVAVLVGGYSVFGDTPAEADGAKVWGTLMQARAKAGREATPIVAPISTLATEAAKRIRAGANSQTVLDDLLRLTRDAAQRSVRGWYMEAPSLEGLTFPPELVKGAEPPLAVGVTWRKQAGEPWGRYVILLVAAAPAQQLTMR